MSTQHPKTPTESSAPPSSPESSSDMAVDSAGVRAETTEANHIPSEVERIRSPKGGFVCGCCGGSGVDTNAAPDCSWCDGGGTVTSEEQALCQPKETYKRLAQQSDGVQRPWNERERYKLFCSGFRTGASGKTMDDKCQGLGAYDRGYAEGVHCRQEAFRRYAEEIGYDPMEHILRR